MTMKGVFLFIENSTYIIKIVIDHGDTLHFNMKIFIGIINYMILKMTQFFFDETSFVFSIWNNRTSLLTITFNTFKKLTKSDYNGERER